MDEKRDRYEVFSVIFLVLGVLTYFIFVAVYISYLDVLAGVKDMQTEENKSLFYGLGVLATAFVISGLGLFSIVSGLIAAIFGCLGAIFSCYNLQCEIEKTRKKARILVAVNGIMAFAFPIFYLFAQHKF